MELWKKSMAPHTRKITFPGHRIHHLLDELYKNAEKLILSQVCILYQPKIRPGAIKGHEDEHFPFRKMLAEVNGSWRVSKSYDQTKAPGARDSKPVANVEWMIIMTAREPTELDDQLGEMEMSNETKRLLSLPHTL